MQDIRVVGLAKAFGKVWAVDHVSFEVRAGSLVTLLGPSGCGKTTTLRLIAGLERPDAGDVYVGDRLLTSTTQAVFTPPEKRNMGMVFQTYAIWPHLTVFENIAFPLREKRVPVQDIRERVMAMLQNLGLEGFQNRPAPLLSGGQQQRVALGRALVSNPDVLLLDEPFSNLDARLREDMRFELKELQAKAGVTTLFVTHDQTEAMILSDHVLVMNAGQIAQEGSPQHVYEHPQTRFIMDFLGQVNHLSARVACALDGTSVAHVESADNVSVPLRPGQKWQEGEEVILAFRPTDVQVFPSTDDGQWRGVILSTVYLGDRVEYVVKVGVSQVRVSGPAAGQLVKGTAVQLHIPRDAIQVWSKHE